MIVMFVVVARAVTRRPAALRWIALLMAAALAGILGEEITYRVLSPGGFELVPAAFVVLDIVVPAIAFGMVLRASR
jgi:hypothetical protein